MTPSALANATILLTRLSHVGDCVLTLPLANSLRNGLPNARIVWVVEPTSYSLLRGHPAVDEFVVVDRRWRRSPRQLVRVRRQLRNVAPSISIDPQSLTKSSLLAWLSGAKTRVGLARPWGRELAPQLNNCLMEASREHLVDRSLELLTFLGLESRSPRFRLPLSTEAQRVAHDIRRERHLLGRYYVINPGASWISKRWPPSEFGRVARQVGCRHQIPALVTWAGELERRMAEEIVARSGGHAFLAPATSLKELYALLHAASFFVGSDTGPLHMAAAAQTSCVALFGPTRPEASGPYGPGHLVLQADSPGRTSRANRRTDTAAIRAICSQDVINACEQMIARTTIVQTSPPEMSLYKAAS